jgi:branched-chain amino acid transport system ATP-binding protein
MSSHQPSASHQAPREGQENLGATRPQVVENEKLLETRDLSVAYGGIQAVKGISITVDQGELVTLIGANGAGKTTTLKAITGLLKRQAGDVFFQGQSTQGHGTWDLVAQGLVMVPEGRGVFTRMTIAENLTMGAYLRRDRLAIQADLDRVYSLFARLHERRTQLAGTLSGGEQQMLAIGRALMARPRLLLLDEPSMGLSPMMVDTIFEVIHSIHQGGATVLLVEQNATRALQLASRGYVMESGQITLQNTALSLLNDPGVRAAYLGE